MEFWASYVLSCGGAYKEAESLNICVCYNRILMNTYQGTYSLKNRIRLWYVQYAKSVFGDLRVALKYYIIKLPKASHAVITSRATAGIAFTQQAILRFFAPQGRHDSRITMKFGIAEETLAVPNFTLIREYLGVSGPKNAKNCQNFRLARCRWNP